MASNYIQPGDILTFAAPGGGVVSGGLYIIGGIAVIAMHDADATKAFEGKVNGVWELAKVGSQAWTAGDKVYWDDGNDRATKTATDGALIGVAAADVANGAGDTKGKVRLNGGASETSEGPQAAIASLTDNGGGTADGTVASQAEPVTLTDNTGDSGTHDDTLADGLTATAPDAITEYTPHASGGTTVTSNAATDLDTTAAALNTLVDEVQALQVTVAACVTDLTVQNQNDSDLAQKVIELVTLSGVAQDNLKECTAKIEAILVALRAAGIIVT